MAPLKLQGQRTRLQQKPLAYSPDILPLLQSLLRTLADIDFEFERDLELIANSTIDETLKQKAVSTLRQRHEERRTPYLREIAALQGQIEAMLALPAGEIVRFERRS